MQPEEGQPLPFPLLRPHLGQTLLIKLNTPAKAGRGSRTLPNTAFQGATINDTELAQAMKPVCQF